MPERHGAPARAVKAEAVKRSAISASWRGSLHTLSRYPTLDDWRRSRIGLFLILIINRGYSLALGGRPRPASPRERHARRGAPGSSRERRAVARSVPCGVARGQLGVWHSVGLVPAYEDVRSIRHAHGPRGSLRARSHRPRRSALPDAPCRRFWPLVQRAAIPRDWTLRLCHWASVTREDGLELTGSRPRSNRGASSRFDRPAVHPGEEGDEPEGEGALAQGKARRGEHDGPR